MFNNADMQKAKGMLKDLSPEDIAALMKANLDSEDARARAEENGMDMDQYDAMMKAYKGELDRSSLVLFMF